MTAGSDSTPAVAGGLARHIPVLAHALNAAYRHPRTSVANVGIPMQHDVSMRTRQRESLSQLLTIQSLVDTP